MIDFRFSMQFGGINFRAAASRRSYPGAFVGLSDVKSFIFSQSISGMGKSMGQATSRK